MTRISENQIARSILTDIINNRTQVARYSEELSSGLKVSEPGDSKQAGTIAQFQNTLEKIEAYKKSITYAEAFVTYQEDILGEANELLVRAQEIAGQGANETNSPNERAQLAQEVFEIREHMVSLANSTYQGRYIYHAAADDTPPYSRVADFTNPATADMSSYRWEYDTVSAGAAIQRTVKVTDDLTVTVNTPGNTVFDEAIQGLERLGRALHGYRTEPATGLPDGSGTAFNFPADYDEQTQDILDAMQQLDQARESDIMPERTNLAGRLRRLQTASSLIDVSETTAKDVLGRLQDADMVVSASNLTQAQTALQASLQVTSQVLRQSIMDYI